MGGGPGAGGVGGHAGGGITGFDVLADFEEGFMFNRNPLWDGAFASDADASGPSPPQTYLTALVPPRANLPPVATMSTSAVRMSELGNHTQWGTVLYADLKSTHDAVDLGSYAGISLWARSTGPAGVVVKVAVVDYGSYPQVNTAQYPQPCDPFDTTMGSRSCYDDYAVKIFPDASWRRYDIPFSSLATEGWGLAHAFDPSRIYRVKLSMPPGAI
jgi:hypothetical protein